MRHLSIGIALVLSALIYTSIFGQSPEGMAYQAVVRNGTGTPVTSTPVGLRFSILQGGATGTAVYVETQGATTNEQGVVALTIGDGSPVLGTFTAIDWANGPYFLKVEVDPNNQGTYPLCNVSQLQSVPYALYAKSSSSSYWSINQSGGIYPSNGGNVGIGTATPNGMLEVKGTDSDPTVPLFEVKDINGNPVFVVYPDGVEVTVDMAATGRPAKGGFAVSGRNSTRGTTTDIMRVTPDSTTVYINNSVGRPAKGGFAVSGRNSTRAGVTSNILTINADSTRIYTGDPNKGFGVGEIGTGLSNSYLKLLPENYFIGHQSGQYTTGLFNTFFGYNAGLSNTTGSSNIFIGYEVGRTNTSGSYNTFLGYQAGYTNNASYNSFIGYQAGRSNTSGQYNSFMGYKTGLANTTGSSNVYIGDSVGVSSTSGNKNVFLGNLAGRNNVSGYNNVYIGYQAGFLGNYGSQNICIGNYSGYSNTTGQNLFIGEYAGQQNTSGSRNSCVGFFSGQNNVTGGQNSYFGQFAGMDNLNSYNTFIGYWAGGNNVNGTMNAYLGYRSGQGSTGSNNVFLGYMAGENCSGTGNVLVGYMAGYGSSKSDALYIANSNTTTPLIGGDFSNKRVGINRMPTTYTLEVGGTIWANGSAITAGLTTWSDRRFKTNIVPIPDALNIVMKLNGVRFDWNRGAFPNRNFTEGKQVGLIAQDVETVLPEVVSTDGEGYKSVAYDKVSAVLVEAIKQQQNQIEELKAQVAKLNEQVKQLLNSK